MPVVVPVRVHTDDLVCWWLATTACDATACGKKVPQTQLTFGTKDTAITCLICASLKVSR